MALSLFFAFNTMQRRKCENKKSASARKLLIRISIGYMKLRTGEEAQILSFLTTHDPKVLRSGVRSAREDLKTANSPDCAYLQCNQLYLTNKGLQPLVPEEEDHEHTVYSGTVL